MSKYICPAYYGVKEKISKSFAQLRKMGYFARMNFWCCSTCAWADVPEEKSDKVIFYHNQDNDSLKESGSTYLAWASPNPQEIIDVLKNNGLTVEWDGKSGTRILVS